MTWGSTDFSRYEDSLLLLTRVRIEASHALSPDARTEAADGLLPIDSQPSAATRSPAFGTARAISSDAPIRESSRSSKKSVHDNQGEVARSSFVPPLKADNSGKAVRPPDFGARRKITRPKHPFPMRRIISDVSHEKP